MKGDFAITLFPSRRNASKAPCASRDPQAGRLLRYLRVEQARDCGGSAARAVTARYACLEPAAWYPGHHESGRRMALGALLKRVRMHSREFIDFRRPPGPFSRVIHVMAAFIKFGRNHYSVGANWTSSSAPSVEGDETEPIKTPDQVGGRKGPSPVA
jgi:hypothetical protein